MTFVYKGLLNFGQYILQGFENFLETLNHALYQLHMTRYIILIFFFFMTYGHSAILKSRLQNQSLTISIKGEIFPPLVKNFNLEVKKFKGFKTLILNLDSPGGYVDEGFLLIDRIKTLKDSGIEIHTTVKNGNKCASMCVPIFMQGSKRSAGEVSSFMFHGAFGGFSNTPIESETKRLIDSFTESDVSQIFLQKLIDTDVFNKPGQYWITGQELFDNHSNIVTNIINRHIIFKPTNLNPWFDRPR